MILKWNEFENDLLFESLINETYVYYIKDFKDILYKLSLQSPIAKDLIDLEYKDVKNDMTFISLSDREGYISGSTLRSLKNNIEKSFTDWAKQYNLGGDRTKEVLSKLIDKIEKGETSQSDVNHLFNEYDLGSKSRNDVKLGRLVNALLPGKYTSKDIEDFTNKFKATLSKQGERFEEVSGDDINHWYNYENYKEMRGSLGNSCMAKKNGLFDIYVENPDVCKMLILVEDDKLIGRAIVWKLNSMEIYGQDFDQNRWFMDRQYTIEDSYVEKFRNYAKENGWVYKTYNNHHSFSNVTINEVEKNTKMTVKVDIKNYKKYPYMDTFKRFDPNSGTLYNDEDQDEEYEGQYILNDTGGGYEEIEGGLWSEWHDCRIPEDRAVWSDWADSYLWDNRSIYVEIGSRRYRGSYYPEDCEDIVYSSWYDESIHINDAVYCEAYGDYILSDDAVQVIEDVEFDGEPSNWSDNWYHDSDDNILSSYYYSKTKWYEILSNRWNVWVDCDYAKKDLFSKDYKDDYIIDIFSIIVYKVEGEENIQWLSELDAEILGIKIGNEERLTDKFDYELIIENIRMSLKDKLRRKIKRMEDILNDKGQLQFKFDEEETERYKTGIRSKLNPYKERLKEIERGTFYE